MPDSLKSVRTRNTMTPQSQQADPRQVPNSGGGYTFTISPMGRAKRFLFLGSEKSYYTGGEKLSKQNADNLIALIDSGHSTELVDLIVEVSSEGRAPKQQPGLFALAVASSFGTDAERSYALGKLPAVARTASTLFTFVGYVEQFRGWGRGLRNAIASWYTDKNVDDLAYQVVKYRNREGWSHRDILRLSHPTSGDVNFQALGEFILRGEVIPEHVPSIVEGFQKAQEATTSADWARLVSEYRLSWEMLPTEALNERAVWEALLDTKGSLPLGALLRNLPKLTNVGVIGSGLRGSSRTPEIVARLTDAEALKKARIHPIALLTAMKTYASGTGRSQTWVPNTQVIDALDRAFYLAFGAVTPANKRTLIGLDISGSMGGGWYAGYPQQGQILTPREITAAISLVTVATEPQVEVVGFSHNVIPLNITARQRLDDVIRNISNLPFGSTDCAAAMNYAIQHNLDVDTFLVMTDNETNSGRTHPHEALKRYRDKTGIPAKLIVLATTATEFSIADPSDSGMLDVPGFDSSVPQVISEFSRGF